MSRRTPKCAECGISVPVERTFIDGRWRCPDCTYEYEYGEVERQPVQRGARRVAQEEGLFPLSTVPKANAEP
jgi:tRNA(Ile2) C34 agmatinyltransferase TiaS